MRRTRSVVVVDRRLLCRPRYPPYALLERGAGVGIETTPQIGKRTTQEDIK